MKCRLRGITVALLCARRRVIILSRMMGGKGGQR